MNKSSDTKSFVENTHNKNMIIGRQFAERNLMLLLHKVTMQGKRNYKPKGIF